MLLAEPEKYRDDFNAINKGIIYIPAKHKKYLRKKILSYESIAKSMHHNHILVN